MYTQVMLSEQYRMNKEIADFSSQAYYHSKVLSPLKFSIAAFNEDFPIVFIDCKSPEN
jgi:superfamily I DNA and/or RNA helicase